MVLGEGIDWWVNAIVVLGNVHAKMKYFFLLFLSNILNNKEQDSKSLIF